ncbi:hypothetical protein WJX72_010427 [[Myrmecia] bisecta]|uniref:Uncharacterized protein n=1 Tax=[Myrmecia] bisecta TaxID=41462 RepID=A0AAW1PKN5_9CHLO
MSSERLLARYRQLYSKAQAEIGSWTTLQAQTVALLSACINITNRLPAMQNAANYGPDASLPALQRVVLGKQLEKFEVLFSQITKNMSSMQDVVQRLSNIADDARQKMQAEQASPSAARSAPRTQSTGPTVSSCVQGLQVVQAMFHDEFRLKSAMISKITFGTSAADLAVLLQIFSDQPNVEQSTIDDIFSALTSSEASKAR